MSGNPFPAEFIGLLAVADGPVLDCGSAGRRWPGVVSLDIEPISTVDVRADALDLPFPDDTFAVVLSQAVLEHVTDPYRYMDEITRVTRPGGVLFIEAAFMQPVHCAPHHYFNITPFGLDRLCRHLDVIHKEPIGSMAESWDWVGGMMGAREVLGPVEFAWVRDAMAQVDREMTVEQLSAVAPGVRLVARKR